MTLRHDAPLHEEYRCGIRDSNFRAHHLFINNLRKSCRPGRPVGVSWSGIVQRGDLSSNQQDTHQMLEVCAAIVTESVSPELNLLYVLCTQVAAGTD